MNYDLNHKFSSRKNNKFEWQIKSGKKSPNKIFNFYEKLNLLKKHSSSSHIECAIALGPDNTFKNITNKEYLNLIKKLYDDDFFVFKKNYIQYVRNEHIEKYSNHQYILNYHYFFPIKNFSLHEIFPGASIFYFYAKNKAHELMLVLLNFIKNNIIKNSAENLKNKITQIIATLDINTPSFFHKPYDDMIGIDVGNFFFEDDDYYIDEIENIFSNALNKKIILDRNLLNEYKKNNKTIIKKWLGVFENTDKFSSEEIVKFILKEPLIDLLEIFPNDY